jgi:hypothetical protein
LSLGDMPEALWDHEHFFFKKKGIWAHPDSNRGSSPCKGDVITD